MIKSVSRNSYCTNAAAGHTVVSELVEHLSVRTLFSAVTERRAELLSYS